MVDATSERDLGTVAFEFAVLGAGDRRAALSASGELDRLARGGLDDFLQSQITVGRVFLRLDLSRATAIDSGCFHTLTDAHFDCEAAHGMLVLEGISEQAHQALADLHLDRCLYFTHLSSSTSWLSELTTPADNSRPEAALSLSQGLPAI